MFICERIHFIEAELANLILDSTEFNTWQSSHPRRLTFPHETAQREDWLITGLLLRPTYQLQRLLMQSKEGV